MALPSLTGGRTRKSPLSGAIGHGGPRAVSSFFMIIPRFRLTFRGKQPSKEPFFQRRDATGDCRFSPCSVSSRSPRSLSIFPRRSFVVLNGSPIAWARFLIMGKNQVGGLGKHCRFSSTHPMETESGAVVCSVGIIRKVRRSALQSRPKVAKESVNRVRFPGVARFCESARALSSFSPSPLKHLARAVCPMLSRKSAHSRKPGKHVPKIVRRSRMRTLGEVHLAAFGYAVPGPKPGSIYAALHPAKASGSKQT